jgi:flagellar FliJ protein
MAKKGLHTLIRVRKWEVDEKQRAVGLLLRDEEKIIEFQVALDRELDEEKALVSQSAANERMTFEPYIRRWRQRHDNLEAALILIRRKIEEAREELAEAYRRLKTFEITQDQRDTAEEKEENRLEQISLDEMGIDLHRRKASSHAT